MHNALKDFLAKSPDSSLLLGPGSQAAPGKYQRVAIAVADRQELRAYDVPPGVRSASIAVLLETGTSALGLLPRPDWPPLTSLRSRVTAGGVLLVVRFARPVLMSGLVAELGRQSVWPDRVGNRGLFATTDADRSEKVPPDVLVGDPAPSPVDREPFAVTGRSLYQLTDLSDPLALGRLDERILNPIGFSAHATEPATTLAEHDLRAGPTERLVDSLRPAAGVRVDLTGGADKALLRSVAGLAMAGIPLTAEHVAADAARLLGEPVSDGLTAPVDLSDPLAREEHSVVLRRAALDTFASYGWADKVGKRAGVRVATQPAVSIVLATRRPEQLDFALAQVARQRGVESLQLVLAPHGFDVDPAALRESLGDRVSVQVTSCPASTLFGDVLAQAVDATDGDVVLKMDDDDWYGPDVIADLLRARAYSGAEMVGMPAEFHYLAPRELTVKRGHPAELYTNFVAGGTMMVGRTLLREVGSFRSVRKHVDASLLAAVAAAGGAVYRTHGLGYLLRRNASGHTWEVDMEYLLDPSRVERTWPGLTPSRLMELTPTG